MDWEVEKACARLLFSWPSLSWWGLWCFPPLLQGFPFSPNKESAVDNKPLVPSYLTFPLLWLRFILLTPASKLSFASSASSTSLALSPSKESTKPRGLRELPLDLSSGSWRVYTHLHNARKILELFEYCSICSYWIIWQFFGKVRIIANVSQCFPCNL